MTGLDLHIVGLGACTPVGRNVWASAAAARAGICGFAEHPYMVDTAGEPMRIARAPWIDIGVEGAERYAELLLPAMDEALHPLLLAGATSPVRWGLALALPPPRPGRPHDLADALLARMSNQYADRRAGRLSAARVFEAGHAAGHLALEAAAEVCAAGSVDACLVCGVDSGLAPETLEWTEACDQVHGGGASNNAWGFVPGEAAGAVLVASEDFTRRAGLDTLGQVVGLGIGHERHHIKTGNVCIGVGLTEAVQRAFQMMASGEIVHNVFCDLNGEPYRADEYGFTVLRTRDRFRAPDDFIAPADCWGDVGAAGALLHVALAVIASCKRYGKGPLSMVWASSESGERGAALIRACREEG